MNMISQLRQRIARTGTATITTEEFNQLQGEWITRTKMEKDELKASPVEQLVSCKCGWTGKHTELIKKGSVTHADEWWECPACGGDSSKRTTKWSS